MNKIIALAATMTTSALLLISACTPPEQMYCGNVIGIDHHQDLGHFITPDDLKGRWYVAGTTMEPNGSTWAGGICQRQHFNLIDESEGKAVFEETGTWIFPTGQFAGINTMADITKPYAMNFTQPDTGVIGELLETPWTLFALGSEPSDYLALYFCRTTSSAGTTIPVLQGLDILTRTQDPARIAEIEQTVLSQAASQGIFVDNYISYSREGCDPIEDFENQ